MKFEFQAGTSLVMSAEKVNTSHGACYASLEAGKLGAVLRFLESIPGTWRCPTFAEKRGSCRDALPALVNSNRVVFKMLNIFVSQERKVP